MNTDPRPSTVAALCTCNPTDAGRTTAGTQVVAHRPTCQAATLLDQLAETGPTCCPSCGGVISLDVVAGLDRPMDDGPDAHLDLLELVGRWECLTASCGWVSA